MGTYVKSSSSGWKVGREQTIQTLPVAQVTENVSSRKIRLTRDVIYGFTGRAPKNASHIEDLKYHIETFPHPNLENVSRLQDAGGTIPDSCDVWEKFIDWEMLTEEQKQETKTFLLMRFSVDDLQLAYDQYFVQKGKVPSSVEYRIFINNWQGKKTKRRTQSLAEMMRALEQKDEEIHREREEQQIKVAELDLVTHIYNGQLRQLHDLEHENEDLRNTNHRLERDFEQERQDKDHLREITDIQGRHVYQLKKTITEKDRQLCEKCTRNRELKETKDEYQGVIKRQKLMLKERKEENRGLSDRVGGLSEENRGLSDRVGELNGRVGELSHDKEVLNDKMEEVNNKNEELNIRNKELNSKISDLNNNVEDLNNQNMEQSATINKQSATINKQSATINEQSATINDLHSENSGLKSENSGLKSENSELKSENSGLKSEVSELSATVNTLIDQNQDKNKTIAELIGQTKQLVALNGSHQETIDNLKCEIENLKSENGNMKSKLDMEVHVSVTKDQIIAEQSQEIEELKKRLVKDKEHEGELRKQMDRQDEINRDLYEQLADVKQLCSKLMMKIQARGEQ